MRSTELRPLACLMLVSSLIAAHGCGHDATGTTSGALKTTSPIEHGQYLAENVMMCMDCHTPMGPQGPMMDRHLQGGPLVFEPLVPVPDWTAVAPPIAGGYPGWTREELVRFLETGVNPQGNLARPPMPHYRLKRNDAEALADYLISLRPAH